MEGLGFGLAALAFWGFIAAVVVAGIWYAAKEQNEQHETVRRIVESGRDIDAEAVDRIFHGNKQMDRDLKVGGLITVAVAPGLAILGWFLSFVSEKALMPLLGVAALVACVGFGLLAAARYVERSYNRDKQNTPL
jgi:hypothetical protein